MRKNNRRITIWYSDTSVPSWDSSAQYSFPQEGLHWVWAAFVSFSWFLSIFSHRWFFHCNLCRFTVCFMCVSLKTQWHNWFEKSRSPNHFPSDGSPTLVALFNYDWWPPPASYYSEFVAAGLGPHFGNPKSEFYWPCLLENRMLRNLTHHIFLRIFIRFCSEENLVPGGPHSENRWRLAMRGPELSSQFNQSKFVTICFIR